MRFFLWPHKEKLSTKHYGFVQSRRGGALGQCGGRDAANDNAAAEIRSGGLFSAVRRDTS